MGHYWNVTITTDPYNVGFNQVLTSTHMIRMGHNWNVNKTIEP